MNKLHLLLVTLLLCCLPINALAGTADISTGNVDVIVIKQSGKYTNMSIKLDVTNTGNPANVYIKVKALDVNGFELSHVMLSDTFQAQTKSMTTTKLIENSVINKIDKWQADILDALPIR